MTTREITILGHPEVYLRRWSLWLPGRYSIKIHQILRPDEDRCSHDHPFDFLRFILWGGYEEEVRNPETGEITTHLRKPFRFYWCGEKFAHRITKLSKKSSWTLLFCGPKKRSWGFFLKDRWMEWRKFVNTALERRVLWCEDGRTLNEE